MKHIVAWIFLRPVLIHILKSLLENYNIIAKEKPSQISFLHYFSQNASLIIYS